MHICVCMSVCIYGYDQSLEERSEFHGYNFVASKYVRIGFTRRNVYKECQEQRKELV